MGATRRDFLKTTVMAGSATAIAATAGAAFGQTRAADPAHPRPAPAPANLPLPKTTRRGDMLYRMLGQTGVEVSLIGLGGFHIGTQKTEEESIRIIRTAIDRGITFMDNCWDYNEGASEIRMGKALRDGYRQKVFLMSKIDGRSKEAAAKQIDESLQRLQAERVDLMQFHEIVRMEDPDRIFATGGAMEAMAEARQAGKVRFIGFTGHKDPLIHLRMLEVAAKNGFKFDVVQMPLNVMDAHFRSFQNMVLPVLAREQIGVVNMKPLGGGVIVKSKMVTPIECLHYDMNLPTSCVITGMDRMELLDQAFEAARTFEPLTSDQVAALLDRTREAAMSGHFELFKTTAHFDGTAKHPDWLG